MASRIRPLYLCMLVALIVTSSRVSFVHAQAPAAPRPATAYELIDAVNSYRGQKGLPAYTVSSILMGTAQNQAAFMASAGTVTHTGPGGISFPDRLTAAGYSFVFRSENILSTGSSASGWDLVTSSAWADSAHQHTMLSSDLCEVGAGVAVSGALAYYVLDAACPSGSSGGNTPIPGAPTVIGGGAATAVVVLPNTPKPDGSISHLVRPGETLWSIAIAYKTTIAVLKANNRLADDNIYPGDTLTIFFPAATPTPAPTATATPVPTATPFVFWTVTSPPEPTVTPIPASPVAGGSGMIVVGIIVISALLAAGALTAAGARRR